MKRYNMLTGETVEIIDTRLSKCRVVVHTVRVAYVPAWLDGNAPPVGLTYRLTQRELVTNGSPAAH